MRASELVDKKIADYPDWRGTLLATIRRLVLEADPEIGEELKWRGAPTWSHDGLVCLANVFKDTVKVVFSAGATLADPDRLFNSELTGNAWRGITLSENEKLNERAFKNMVRAAVELNTTRKAGKSRSGKAPSGKSPSPRTPAGTSSARKAPQARKARRK